MNGGGCWRCDRNRMDLRWGRCSREGAGWNRLCWRSIGDLVSNSPWNNEVDEINDEVLKQFLGEERLYSSADSVKGAEEGNHYSLEYLNSIAISGLPPS